jgi:hypothetical protein
MSDIFITNEEARDLLRVYIRERGRGAVKALAAEVGLSRCFVSTMLSGPQPISPLIAVRLGLRAVRGFVRADVREELS